MYNISSLLLRTFITVKYISLTSISGQSKDLKEDESFYDGCVYIVLFKPLNPVAHLNQIIKCMRFYGRSQNDQDPYWFNSRFIDYGVSSGYPFHYPSIYTLLRDTVARVVYVLTSQLIYFCVYWANFFILME